MDDFCTQLLLLASNLCAAVAVFLTVDRYFTLSHG